MPRPRKKSAPAPAAKTQKVRPSGLVGRSFRSVRMVGQIVAEVTPGQTYLVQPFEADGTPSAGQRLVEVATMLENSPALGYYFYESITEALAATPNLPSVPLPSLELTGSRVAPKEDTAKPRKERKTLEREPRVLVTATPTRADGKPVVPPAVETSPAPVEEKSDPELEPADPERAMESLLVLVGQHGIVSLRRVEGVVVVEVNGDTTEAQEHVPEFAFGVRVHVKSVTLLKNGAEKPAVPAPSKSEPASADGRPF